jgi:SAM-dependent methyltransferase
MTSRSYRELLACVTETPFSYIEPPFNFNAPEVTRYPPEVTGFNLLESMRRRLGWASLEGKALLDFGCGVRFARTIHNLGLPLASYVGVDVNADAIAWLQSNLTDGRFTFAHLDARNALYNPDGETDPDALARLNLPPCDAACMFSVITHQGPEEARLTFTQLRRVASPGGQLYFTAFIDEAVQHYTERIPNSPGSKSTYEPETLIRLVESAGWGIEAIYPKIFLQQQAMVCAAV